MTPKTTFITADDIDRLRNENCERQFAICCSAPLKEVCLSFDRSGRRRIPEGVSFCPETDSGWSAVAPLLAGSRVFFLCTLRTRDTERDPALYAIGRIEAASERYLWAVPDFFVEDCPDVSSVFSEDEGHTLSDGIMEISEAAGRKLLNDAECSRGEKVYNALRFEDDWVSEDMAFDLGDVPDLSADRLIRVCGKATDYRERTGWDERRGFAELRVEAFGEDAGAVFSCVFDPTDSSLLAKARALRRGDPVEVSGLLTETDWTLDRRHRLEMLVHDLVRT
ncbi:MAG: hypothetical protein J5758_02575, partial [Abditibacteriota bacterium]|nr:hypothetical protein [Abditibacteriota bacterium]